MPDPTERPDTPSAPHPPAPALRVPPPPSVAAVAPLDPALEGEPYRPVSVLAIVGFTISLLFTASLLLVGGVALLRQFPLYYPLVLMLPLAGLGFSVAGLLRIQRSEGTLAGGKLALWGAFLGLLTALSYSAYLVAITVVISNQSIAATKAWIAMLEEGDVDRAFNVCLSPESRSRKEGKQLREDVEDHNRSENPNKPGPVTEFARSPFPQFLHNSGTDTQIEFIGVHDWDYTEGGYQVHVECRLVTREATATVMVGLFGTSRPGTPGRDWTMLPKQTKIMVEDRGGFVPTAYGELAHRVRRDEATKFAQSWLWDIHNNRAFSAYLATRPPQDRAQLRERFRLDMAERVAVGMAAPCRGLLADPSWYLPGYREFTEGKYCLTEPNDFYPSDPKVRGDVFQRRSQLEAARRAIREGRFSIEPSADAMSTRKDDVLTVEVVLQLLLPPYTMVEGAVMVETDARALDRGEAPKTWRVANVQIYRSRTVMSPGPNFRPPIFGPGPERPLPMEK